VPETKFLPRLLPAQFILVYVGMMKTEIPDDWDPTPDRLNALPKALQRYLHDLHTNTDPARLVRENFRLRQENAALRRQCERLAEASGKKAL